MRSLQPVVLVLLASLPVAFASCSSDESDEAQNGSGGDAHVDGGNPGDADAGETSSPGHGGAGASQGGRGATTDAGATGDGGTAPTGDGGTAPTGDGGTAPTGDGGTEQGGTPTSDAGSPSGGGGGEAGAPDEPSPIVLFDAGAHNGLNFGGRVGLDAFCSTAKGLQSIPGAKTHALISVSEADELRDMPSLYGLPTDRAFVSSTDKLVADDFADLLDGSIALSLADAGISSAQFWLSGSNTDGSVRKTCNGWTSNEFNQQVTGTYGYPGNTDSMWITVTGGDVYCSASQYVVICAAWD